MDFSDLEQKYGSIQRFDPKAKKVSGRGGPATAYISEAAGTGGALAGAAGGAALGTAILPGLGTLVGGGLGGLIGGFTGGFGGRAVENKVRDDEFRLEDALSEGALSGAFGALGGVGRGLQATKAAGSAAKATSKAGKVANVSDDLLAKSRGITPGVGKTSTRAGLSTAEARRLNKVATDLGVNKLTPKANLEAVEAAKSTLLSQRDDVLRQAGKLPKNSISNIKRSLTSVVDDTPGINSLDDIAPDLAKLGKQDSVAGLTKFRQGIDDLINFNRASATPDPKMDRVYKALRRSIDDELSKVNSQLKSINSTLKDVYSLEDLFQESTKRQVAGTGAMRIPFAQTKLPGGSTQAIQNIGARVAGAPSALTGAIPGASTGLQIGRKLAPGMIARGAVETGTSTEPQLEDVLMGAQDTGMGAGFEMPQAQPELYSKEALLYDIQRDPQNMDEYIKTYETLQSIFGAQSQEPLNSTAAGVVADTKTGLNALEGLSTSISDSGANVPFLGGLRAKNPFDTEAQNLQAQVATAKQIVGKALEGGVLRKEDEIKYAKLLPTMNDTDAVAQFKIQELQRLISSRLNEYLSGLGQGGGGNLEDVLLQLQGAQ